METGSRTEVIIEALSRTLTPSGLDLIAPFDLADYQREVEPAYRLPELGRAHALAILVGNTRAIWPHFLRALAASPERLEDRHPLDRFVEEAVLSAARSTKAPFAVRFAHDPPPSRFAAQRAARIAGLAHLSESHLSVHPVFGPWLALRAALVFDANPPPRPSPPEAPCRCAEGCRDAFARAHEGGSEDWRSWLEVRDACPAGRAHRYEETQILYHYTKDRAALIEALDREGSWQGGEACVKKS